MAKLAAFFLLAVFQLISATHRPAHKFDYERNFGHELPFGRVGVHHDHHMSFQKRNATEEAERLKREV